MGRKEKQIVSEVIISSEKVKIKNWAEWFAMCGTIVQDLKAYESAMETYFFDTKYTKVADAQNKAQMEYQAKHRIGFYEDEKKLPRWIWKPLILGVLVALLLGFVAAYGLTILSASKANVDVTTYLRQKGTTLGAQIGVYGMLLGIVFSVVYVFLRIKAYTWKRNKLFRKMELIEMRLENKIRYIPPRYRNSQAVGAFYDLYCSYGVVTFNQAITACDDYLMKNNLVGAYMAIMFDVPYSAGLAEEPKQSARGLSIEKETEKSNPALPDDIQSKTFTGVDDADARLNELVGLEHVKEQIRQMKNRMNFYGSKSKELAAGNHMVFLGPPGTGKTTIARIVTKVLYDFGYIRENRCVEVDGGYLKSPYVGQTPERVHAIIEYARGGVLFIDEAYVLSESKSNAQSGVEAIGILLKAMEDYKSDLVCIMAGYEDNMNRMLTSNEGFASRIKYKVYFDNFSVEEMGQIFRNLMRTSTEHRYRMDKSAFDLLMKHFEKEQRVPGFGNARVVLNAWDGILDVHADRFMRGEILQEQKFILLPADVQAYIAVRQKQMVEDGRNFIATRNLDTSVISLQELKQKTRSGSENPDEELAAMIGLSVVKDEIARMKAQFEFYGGNLENNGNHMAFIGPPGTGKTTVAKIMTGYLYQMGIIQENSYLDINGDFLRGMYLGHTGKRTEAVVQYSQGMVLFIDEAYLLTSSTGTSDAFGQEAVGVLIDAMEKYRKNFVVILAGYDEEMANFLNMNSGLQSRISLICHFKSYTPNELAYMFRDIAAANGFTVQKNVWLPLQRYFKTQLTVPKFGNGRFVRQLFEDVKKSHIMNFVNSGQPEDNRFVIQLEDIEDIVNGTAVAVNE